MKLIPVDYVDDEGRKRRVLLPDDDQLNPTEGIPVSIELDSLFEGASSELLAALHNSLWVQGLIEADDYFKPGAPERYKRAFLSVIRMQFVYAKQLANEAKQHA